MESFAALSVDEPSFDRPASPLDAADASPADSIIVGDATGVIRAASASIEPLCGWRPEELMGERVTKLMSQGDWDVARESACAPDREYSGPRSRLMRSQLEVLISCRDEATLVCEMSLLRMASTLSDEPPLFACLIRDRARRADHETRIQRIAIMQRAFMNALVDPLITIDGRGTIRLASDAVKKVFGWAPEELLGQNISMLMPEPHSSNHDVYLERYRRTGIAKLLNSAREMEAVRKDGSTFRCEVNATRVDIPGVGEPFFTGILRDTTERHELLERALAASSAKSNFLATMSHEIRTPMNAILGFSSRLLEDELTPRQHRRATIIRDAGIALLDLINNILDLSKIEANKLMLEVDAFELSEVVLHTVELMRPLALDKGLALDCKLDPTIPKCLRGDQARIRQVLMNLLGNALKFTDTGSIGMAARVVEADLEFALIRIDVSDTGIGIPKDRQRQIFEPFVQANNVTTRQHGGTGLGLTITKRLVEMMGGSLELRSEPGRGSTFAVTVPLLFGKPSDGAVASRVGVPSPNAMRTASQVRPRAADARRLEGTRILYAEDNEANRALALEVLEEEGATVDIAVDGDEALRLLKERTYHLALIDIQMPEIDGYHVVRETRKKEESTGTHLPMVALTAFAMQGDREKCLNQRFDDYVTKPFDGPQLVALVQRYAAPSPV
jgi:PAS domain S-box-containing protein